MMLTFFFEKKFIFSKRHAFLHQNLYLWNTAVASLEHNHHIFGTQRTEESNYNTVTINNNNNNRVLFDNTMVEFEIVHLNVMIKRTIKDWQCQTHCPLLTYHDRCKWYHILCV